MLLSYDVPLEREADGQLDNIEANEHESNGDQD